MNRRRDLLSRQPGPGLGLRCQSPLTTSDSELEPDLCIVKGDRAALRKSHPTTAELVIEVAVSSLEIEHVKALFYPEACVAECWIVCPTEKRVEIYRQPAASGYTVQLNAGPDEVLESSAPPAVR